jgi:hypothetical protein
MYLIACAAAIAEAAVMTNTNMTVLNESSNPSNATTVSDKVAAAIQTIIVNSLLTLLGLNLLAR